MNKIYHSIWNEALGAWIAVSEIAKGQGKRSTNRRKNPMTASPLKDWQSFTPLLATGLFLFSSASWALPTGEQLVSGQATVSNPTAGQMQIDQASQNAIVNWQGFSIAPNETVNIHQPNAQAALLNRVVGADASQIQGQLTANGQVYLSNPNGVLFSKTAQVDVGGLIATTHDITNQDFMAGKNHFTQNGATGTVENQGTIKVPEGGVVALIGTQVSNTGTIETPKGTTALAAGKTVDLDFKGDGLVEVKVTEAALNAQIANKGAITADGGRVVLTAKAAGQLIDTVINQEGIIRAQSLVERNGEIILDGGDNGVVKVSGTLDTGSPKQVLGFNNGNTNQGLNASGGNITVKGANIQFANGANVNASGNTGGGTINIGDKQTTRTSTIEQGASITAQTLVSGKAGTINVLANMDNGTVNVAGQLNAAAPKNGDGGFIDTSAAHVKVADTAKISTKASNGKTGTWLIDPIGITGYTIATSGGDITGGTLSTNLGNTNVSIFSTTGATIDGVGDINVNDAVSWSANLLTLNAQRNININANLNGSGTAQLALQYGQASPTGGANDNYFINNGVKVTLPAGANFSTQKGSTGAVKNYTVITSLGVEGDASTTTLQGMKNGLAGNYALGSNIDATLTSGWNSGAGFAPIGTWNGIKFTGQFHGLGHQISSLTIFNSTWDIGLFGNVGNGGVLRDVGLINAVVGSSINGSQWTGTLAGEISLGATVYNSYAQGGSVNTVSSTTGGLVGLNSGTISNSYATGSVSGTSEVGGLVGYNDGTISNSYATGSVSGTSEVGGLVGYNDSIISNSYATGSVSGTSKVGGLVGWNYGTITNTYATGSVTGTTNVGGLVGSNSGTINNSFWDKTTTNQTTSAGSPDTNGKTTAELMMQSTYAGWDFTNIWWMSEANTRPFLQMEYNTNITNAHQLQLMAMNLDANYTLANNLNLTAELANPSSMWGAAGFVPVGNGTNILDGLGNIVESIVLRGSFDGLGNTITGLSINRPSTDYVGLFGGAGGHLAGVFKNSSIRNIGLIGTNIIGRDNVGGLVGANYGDVTNVYTTGSVTGNKNVGKVTGLNNGALRDSYAVGSVTGNFNVGGLVGFNDYGRISNSHYDVDSMLINGSPLLTVGGLYNAQYQDWITHNKVLTIADYAATLPLDVASGYYLINDLQGMKDLLGFADNPAYKFRLHNSINLSSAAGFFIPYLATEFDGAGHTISKLVITQPFNSNIGMFGQEGRGVNNVIKNLKLRNVDVTGYNRVGGLVGDFSVWDNTISNSSATGKVTGNDLVGGLVGFTAYADTWSHNISDSYASVDVVGNSSVGGLVGDITGGTIFNAYATGKVTADNTAGGLAGVNAGRIIHSYASGEVLGANNSFGGLVGRNDAEAIISDAYATGTVTGNSLLGGLVGENSGSIENAYAVGDVSGWDYVGGLIGNSLSLSLINNTYATGQVTTFLAFLGNVGALVGLNDGSQLSNSFWNTQTSGQTVSVGAASLGINTNVTGLGTAEMMQLATFSDGNITNLANWDISNTSGSSAIWRIYEGYTAPLLGYWLQPLTVDANITETYNGLIHDSLNNASYSIAGAATSGHLFYGANPYGNAINVGSYPLITTLYSDQQGYDISLASPTNILTIINSLVIQPLPPIVTQPLIQSLQPIVIQSLIQPLPTIVIQPIISPIVAIKPIQQVIQVKQEPLIQIKQEQLIPQVSPLQTTTLFHYPRDPKSEHQAMLIRIENSGIKKPVELEKLPESIKIAPTIGCITLR